MHTSGQNGNMNDADTQQHALFVERYVRDQNRVYRYILTLVPNRTEAEELFQQTSLTLWQLWREYDAARPFVPWACAIAHNHIRNFFRTYKGDRNIHLSDKVMDQVAAVRLASEDELEDRRAALTHCISKLDEAQRRLLERCYEASEPIAHVAEQSGMSANALYKLLGRIRRALHECINRTLDAREGSA